MIMLTQFVKFIQMIKQKESPKPAFKLFQEVYVMHSNPEKGEIVGYKYHKSASQFIMADESYFTYTVRPFPRPDDFRPWTKELKADSIFLTKEELLAHIETLKKEAEEL